MSARKAAEGAADRAARAEAALQEALEERNRLWEELQRRRADDADAAYWRERALRMEESAWWRAARPLRLLRRAVADPPAAFEALARRLRARRGR